MPNSTIFSPPARSLVYCASTLNILGEWPSEIHIENNNNSDVFITISAPTNPSSFFWQQRTNFRLPAGQAYRHSIRALSPVTTTSILRITSDDRINPPITVDYTLAIMDGVGSGSVDLRIEANPPLDDLDPSSGEYIQLTNISSADVDLNRCTVYHNIKRADGSSRQAYAHTIKNVPVLRSGQVLNIYSRVKNSGDPAGTGTQQDPFRSFMNKPNPIWNNTGDKAEIVNQCGFNIATTIFDPQGSPPASRTLVSSFRFVINPKQWTIAAHPVTGTNLRLQRDDLVVIAGIFNDPLSGNITHSITGGVRVGNEFLDPRSRRADGSFTGAPTEVAGRGYPMPRGNKWSVIGLISSSAYEPDPSEDFDTLSSRGELFDIGLGARKVVTSNGTGPFWLFLAINDDLMWDNDSTFTCRIDVLR